MTLAAIRTDATLRRAERRKTGEASAPRDETCPLPPRLSKGAIVYVLRGAGLLDAFHHLRRDPQPGGARVFDDDHRIILEAQVDELAKKRQAAVAVVDLLLIFWREVRQTQDVLTIISKSTRHAAARRRPAGARPRRARDADPETRYSPRLDAGEESATLAPPPQVLMRISQDLEGLCHADTRGD